MAFRFTITYTEDEQRIFRKVMAARHTWVGYTVWAVALGAPLGIGLVVLGGFELGSDFFTAPMMLHAPRSAREQPRGSRRRPKSLRPNDQRISSAKANLFRSTSQ